MCLSDPRTCVVGSILSLDIISKGKLVPGEGLGKNIMGHDHGQRYQGPILEPGLGRGLKGECQVARA